MSRFVFFDLDGTLYDFPACAEEALAETLIRASWGFGLSPDAIPRYKELFWQGYFQLLAESDPIKGFSPHATLKQLFRQMLASTGLSPARRATRLASELAQTWLRLFFTTAKPFPGVTSLLTHLQAAGVGLGIISNGPADFQKAKLATLGLKPYFPDAGLFFSAACGLAKPDPAIFALALRRHHLSPQDAIFVGDSPRTDLPGAVQAGLRVVWLNRYGLVAPAEVCSRVQEAATFAEAARQIVSLLQLNNGGDTYDARSGQGPGNLW